jgi:anti-sigma factor ChrR (cupin superfamily)
MSDPRIVLRDLFGPDQDFSRLSWQSFRPGIEIVRLYGSGDAGPSAALLRYAPGARLPAHQHVDYEHIVVLSGSQRDDHDRYDAGSCLIHGPGTSHQVASDQGCVVLAIWNAPVAFE